MTNTTVALGVLEGAQRYHGARVTDETATRVELRFPDYGDAYEWARLYDLFEHATIHSGGTRLDQPVRVTILRKWL